jgi:hypothetical protein
MDLDELPRQARAILEAAAGADDPSEHDRARIDATFTATLRAYGITVPLASSPSASVHDAAASGGATRVKSGAAASPAKIVLTIAGLGALAAGFWQMSYGSSRTQTGAAVATGRTASIGRATSDLSGPPSSATAQSASASQESAKKTVGLGAHAADSAASPVTHTGPRGNTGATSIAVRAASGSNAVAGDSLPAEMALIQSANDAVRQGHYDRALHLLDTHNARFANGILREERRGLRVLALCGLGQTASGLRERARFLRDSPRSVLADKVRSACGPTRNLEVGP